jgi:hypothetical protein
MNDHDEVDKHGKLFDFTTLGCPEYEQRYDEINYSAPVRGEWVHHPDHGDGVVIGVRYEFIYVCFGGNAVWLLLDECTPIEIPEGQPNTYYFYRWQREEEERRAKRGDK